MSWALLPNNQQSKPKLVLNLLGLALKIAERETLAVEQTLESMIILKENVGAIAQQIMRLNEQTNQIGNISSVVTDLANQTNMLALNAAVEAVRAGENAKGFNLIAT